MRDKIRPTTSKELTAYRRLLGIAGAVYLLWWFAVELMWPGAFNPFGSRFAVVLFIFAVLVATYYYEAARVRARFLFLVCLWLITLHYYYLFYGNNADANWRLGAFITVMAISLGFFSARNLLAYSIFVMLLSALLAWLVPALRGSIFLPGLFTILLQANLGLRARLGIIKDLKDSNERFELLFHSTFEGILVHKEGIIEDANEAMTQILGYPRRQLLGMKITDLVHEDDRFFVSEQLKREFSGPYEIRGLAPDGSLIDVEVRGKNFKYDDHVAKLVTVQDIGDRKKAETERIKALTLSENVRIRDEFISIASHELKTPISALKLQTQMIERDFRRGQGETYTADRVRDVLDLFKRQTDRLTELVESMLDVSRIAAGRFTLASEKIDLPLLVRETVAIHTGMAVNSSASVAIDAPATLTIMADRRRLEQVIENLLSNAIKYGDGKSIQIRVFAENGYAVLSVEDHGLGINSDFMPRLFQRFERGIPARNISGLGLGLYIARQIVETHGGSIAVSSHLGSGSTFTVRLPFEQPST